MNRVSSLELFCIAFVFCLLGAVIMMYVESCSNETEVEGEMLDETAWVRLEHSAAARGLFRFVDYEASVVCWIHVFPGSGVSCLPLDVTTLQR